MSKIVITENDVLSAFRKGEKLIIPPNAIITPLAKDTAKEKKVEIVVVATHSSRSAVDSKELTVDGTTLHSSLSTIHPKIIAIASDHGGFELKEKLVPYLKELGYEVKDFGTFSKESVDYPDFAFKVACAVANKECDRGIIIDGAGIGSCIVANKVRGIRAGMCYDLSTTKNSREHNDTNVLTLGAGLIGEKLAKDIVKLWLETPFEGGRHQKRIDKIKKIEKEI